MEDVLELYGQEPSEGKARVCFDERPCQLLNDVVEPLPLKEGKPGRTMSMRARARLLSCWPMT
ncbi:hypothetical protein [Pontibacter kalidii]|uniref:hypothetical protein n=1 Tax=Pontibacter kalidii TaxID=2592049 RepID=UPI00225B8354|nr:hypothetical protein [Pontibacter kalidii]